MTVFVETIRKVYDGSEGACLSIGPDGDGLEMVSVYTQSDTDKEWFGKVSFNMKPEFARKFALAIIAAADEAEKANK